MQPGHYKIQHDAFRGALVLEDDAGLVLFPKATDVPPRWIRREEAESVPDDVARAIDRGEPTGEAMPTEWELTQIKSASKNHYRR